MPDRLVRATLASIADGVLSIDTEARIVFANRAAQSLLRLADAEIVGKHYKDVFRIVDELTRRELESPLKRASQTRVVGEPLRHTLLIAHNGAEVPVDESLAAIYDDQRRIEGTVLVFRDVSSRRRAEQASRLLASIVESSDDAIVSKDTNGIVTSWNRGAERIFGYTAEEMIGRPIRVIAAPDRVQEMSAILERVKSGERVDHYETVRQTKSGRLVNISLTVSPVHDDVGRIVGASKIARDISEQVRVRAEVAEQRERLRVTLGGIADAVVATDNTGRITYLNPVAEHLSGWLPGEAVGQPVGQVFHIVAEETGFAVENPVEAALRGGQTVGPATHTLLVSREAKEIAIDDSASPIRDARGQTIGAVLVIRDITERRASEKRLAAQASELRRANTELKQFAYVVAHDLREPLRNISTFTELLVRRYQTPADDETAAFTRHILEGAARMQSLLDDMLEYSQLTRHLEQSLRLIDCNTVVEKVLSNLAASIAESGALITSDSLPQVAGHETLLIQLFQNLLSNAIKYRSDRPLRVHIGVQRNEHNWIFNVKDNGIGIEPQYFTSIFGVFKRLHGRTIPGTGIGLAICSKVVEGYGGRIWVSSQPGEGSEFFFTLPLSGRAYDTHA